MLNRRQGATVESHAVGPVSGPVLKKSIQSLIRNQVQALQVETTLIGTVRTKQASSQARKGTRGNTGSYWYEPTVHSRARKHHLTSSDSDTTSQAATPNGAKGGALAGTGKREGRESPTMTAPGRSARMAAGRVRREPPRKRVGRAAEAPPGRPPDVGARRGNEVKTPLLPQEIACRPQPGAGAASAQCLRGPEVAGSSAVDSP